MAGRPARSLQTRNRRTQTPLPRRQTRQRGGRWTRNLALEGSNQGEKLWDMGQSLTGLKHLNDQGLLFPLANQCHFLKSTENINRIYAKLSSMIVVSSCGGEGWRRV